MAEPVRDAALEAVEMIGSKKAVTALIDLLDQKTLSVDETAARDRGAGTVQGCRGDQAAHGGFEEPGGRGASSGDRCFGRDRQGQTKSPRATT